MQVRADKRSAGGGKIAINTAVLTEPINSRMVGNPEVGRKRRYGKSVEEHRSSAQPTREAISDKDLECFASTRLKAPVTAKLLLTTQLIRTTIQSHIVSPRWGTSAAKVLMNCSSNSTFRPVFMLPSSQPYKVLGSTPSKSAKFRHDIRSISLTVASRSKRSCAMCQRDAYDSLILGSFFVGLSVH